MRLYELVRLSARLADKEEDFIIDVYDREQDHFYHITPTFSNLAVFADYYITCFEVVNDQISLIIEKEDNFDQDQYLNRFER